MLIPVNDEEVIYVEDALVQVRILEDIILKGNDRFLEIENLYKDSNQPSKE